MLLVAPSVSRPSQIVGTAVHYIVCRTVAPPPRYIQGVITVDNKCECLYISCNDVVTFACVFLARSLWRGHSHLSC